MAEIEEVLEENAPLEAYPGMQVLITRLQTMIGFSQRGMFDEEKRTWDATLIRIQLQREVQLDYPPGLRYFFNHPAPR